MLQRPNLNPVLSGADLSDYSDNLGRVRQRRVFDLRRNWNNNTGAPCCHQNRLNLSKCLTFKGNESFEVLKSRDDPAIVTLCNDILKGFQECQCAISDICRNNDFVRELVNCLGSVQNEDTLIGLMRVFATIFQRIGPIAHDLLDEGLCDAILSLVGRGSEVLSVSALELLSLIVSSCVYARSTVFCLGLNSQIVEIALNTESEAICESACSCIESLFVRADTLDVDGIVGAIPDLITLLGLPHIRAVVSILNALLMIIRKVQGIAYVMYTNGIVEYVIRFLGIKELTELTLKLVGYLCTAPPPQVKILFEAGLKDMLMPVMTPEYVTEVLWVLSNCAESIPHSVTPLVTPEFIEQVIVISRNCSYDCLKESAYFLSTLMVFMNMESLELFMKQEVVDLIVEMFSCDLRNIVLRCLRAICRFVEYAIKTEQKEQLHLILENSDIRQELQNLLDNEPDLWINESMSVADLASLVL